MALSAAVFVALLGLQGAVTPAGVRRTRVGVDPSRKENRDPEAQPPRGQGGVRDLPRGRDRHRPRCGSRGTARPRGFGCRAQRSSSARRTSRRSTSSASSTSRRSKRRASTSRTREIGSTELMQSALTSGKINFYPEYTGVIVQDVFHHATSPKTAAATYKLAKSLEAGKGLHGSCNPTPFYDTDVLAVTNATAHKYGLHSIADLKKAGGVQARRVPGVQDAQHVLRRLHEARTACRRRRSCRSPASRPTPRSTRARSLAADVFSTDPPLAKPSKYTVLKTRSTSPGSRTSLPIVEEVGRDVARLEVHDDGERRVGEAVAAGDHRDEQGGRGRQAVGRGRSPRRS